MITLKKIDSAELDREVNILAFPENSEEELETELALKTEAGFYAASAMSKLGSYAIYDDEMLIGKFDMSPYKNKNFESNNMVDIELSCYLCSAKQGLGTGYAASQKALEILQELKAGDFSLRHISYTPWGGIEEFTYNAVGTIYGYVDGLNNYPSLSVGLKNSGKICAIGGTSDGILMLYLDTDESEVYTADFLGKLKDYSRSLCQKNCPLAIQNAKELIHESKDAYTKIVIAQSVQRSMHDLFSEISSDSEITTELSAAAYELASTSSLDFPDWADGYFKNALRNVKEFSLTPNHGCSFTTAYPMDVAALAASGGGATDYDGQEAELDDRSALGVVDEV